MLPYLAFGGCQSHIKRDFWTAPEILRSEFEEWPTQASDVYSYSIILQELFTRDDPYYELADHMSPEQVLHAIVHNRLRPEPSVDAPIIIRQIMELAWSETPAARPTFEQITKMLRRGRTGRKTIMDNMMEAMEDYTAHLEEEVEAKEFALNSVKTDLDNLMVEMVPPHVMSAMSEGEKVESKIYTALGVVMMEIVDWSTAMDLDAFGNVLQFLDKLITQLNQIVQKYKAFSPPTQLAYSQTLVVGLEKEAAFLGDRCNTVAHMALDILQIASATKPPNSKNSSLPIKLSAHVGVVATGTIGVTSPKFLMLGNGMDVTRALLANADPNTVKISRGLYSHIEKSPDFEFSAKEPEWIICNGTDIEAFVLTGRRKDSAPVSSESSVDSGVDVDRLNQHNDAATSDTSTDIEAVHAKANNTKSSNRTDKPAFYLASEDRSSSKRQGKSSQRNSKSKNPNYKHHKRRDGTVNWEGKRKSIEYPTQQLHSLPLSRISENSDDNFDVMSNDINDDCDQNPILASSSKHTDTTSSDHSSNFYKNSHHNIDDSCDAPEATNQCELDQTTDSSNTYNKEKHLSLSTSSTGVIDQLAQRVAASGLRKKSVSVEEVQRKESGYDPPGVVRGDSKTHCDDSGTECSEPDNNKHELSMNTSHNNVSVQILNTTTNDDRHYSNGDVAFRISDKSGIMKENGKDSEKISNVESKSKKKTVKINKIHPR